MDLAKIVKMLPVMKCTSIRPEEESCESEGDEPPLLQKIEFWEPPLKKKIKKKNKDIPFFSYSLSLPDYATKEFEIKLAERKIEDSGYKQLIELEEVQDSDPPYIPGIEFFMRTFSLIKCNLGSAGADSYSN